MNVGMVRDGELTSPVSRSKVSPERVTAPYPFLPPLSTATDVSENENRASAYGVRAIAPEDRAAVTAIVRDRWGDAGIVILGRLHEPDALQGFVAVDRDDATIVGLLIRRDDGENEAPIVALDLVGSDEGIGTALLDTLKEVGKANGWHRIRAVTTNDNRTMQSFYQKHGFRLTAIHGDSVARARALAPSIPEFGEGNVPMRDELEYEWGVGSGE